MNSAIFVWTSDDARLPANLLSGFLFTDSCLIVGNTGLEQYLKNNPSESLVSCRDGKFAIALADGDKVRVFSDCFGLEPLFYFHDGVKWAVSNSLLALERSLSKMGVCLSFYRPSLEWFSMEGQGLFSGQPISNNTVISGVRLLPLGQEIVLDRQAGLRIESVDQEHLGSVVIGDYQNAIDKFLQSATARMLTLAKLAEPNCFVDLSGGQDSRLVFGIVAKYPHLAELTFARSNKSMEDDYRVAAAVASEYDFRLKSASYTGPKLGGQASFDLWADANAGLYRPIYVPVSDHPRAVVQFNGANFLGKAYVSKNVEERVESWRGSLSPEAFKIVADEFKNSFTDIGVCADSEEAMAQHYMHFRARIHYGRAWYSHFFWRNHSPLMSSEFYRVATYGVALGFSKDRIMCDVMCAVDGKLAKMKFSNAKSQFLQEDVDASINAIAPFAFRDVDALEVYGSLVETPVSTSSVSDEAFEDVFKNRFRRLKRQVAQLDVFSTDFLARAERALDRKSNVREWDCASSVVGIGLLSEHM